MDGGGKVVHLERFVSSTKEEIMVELGDNEVVFAVKMAISRFGCCCGNGVKQWWRFRSDIDNEFIRRLLCEKLKG